MIVQLLLHRGHCVSTSEIDRMMACRKVNSVSFQKHMKPINELWGDFKHYVACDT